MHLLIVDSQSGTGSGHNLAFAGLLVDGARRLRWELTVVSPHPPARGPLHWEPVPPALVAGRAAPLVRARHRANVALAGRLAIAAGADLVVDTYLHPDLGLPRFPAGTPPRARIAHHRLRLRERPVRRPDRRWSPPHVDRLGRLADDGDVLVAMTERGAADLARQVPGARIATLPHPMSVDAPRSDHAPASPPVIAFVGEPRADKGWPELLAALERTTEPMVLEVIAARPAGARPPAVGPVRIVWRTDVADHADFQRALAGADAAVLPHTDVFARRAGFSGSLLEVLAVGLPAVAARSMAADLPDDRVAYRLADPADPADLATALDRLAREVADARAAAVVSGPVRIDERHHPARALAALAEQVLGTPSA